MSRLTQHLSALPFLCAVAGCYDGEPPELQTSWLPAGTQTTCYLRSVELGIEAQVGTASQIFASADQARQWCWSRAAEAEEARDSTPCLGANPCPIPAYNPPPAPVRCRQSGTGCVCGEPGLIDALQGTDPDVAPIVSACRAPDQIPEGSEWACDTWTGLCRCGVEALGLQRYWDSVGAGTGGCP